MSSPEAQRTPDRRQRKSRAALQGGLLHLIPTKAYDAITIEDITAAADVARATFYAHYRDKTALLDEAVRELLAELVERVGALAPPPAANSYTSAAVAAVFGHGAEHRDLYRLVLRGEAGVGARRQLIEAFEAVTTAVFERMVAAPHRTPRAPLPVTIRGFVGAVLLTLEAWLDGDSRSTPDQIATELLFAQVGGVEWSLGYAPGALAFEPA